MAQLILFRRLGSEYFSNIQYASWMADGAPPRENDKSMDARRQINRIMDDLILSFDLVGISHVVTYTPPPIIGGYVQNIDVLLNLFDIWRWQLDPNTVKDFTERAIGAYEREFYRLRRKVFNPLYWLGIFFVWFLRLPFRFLTAAGFNGTKIEGSLFGSKRSPETALTKVFGSEVST